jgi:hypothetical protein
MQKVERELSIMQAHKRVTGARQTAAERATQLLLETATLGVWPDASAT